MKISMSPRRSIAEKILSLLLICSMSIFFIPVTTSAASNPIGQVVTSGSSSITRAEGTLFNGDQIQTAAQEQTAVTLKDSSLLNFRGSTSARIAQSNGKYRVDLQKGEVLFASTPSSREPLTIGAAGVEVLVPGGTPAKGSVLTKRNAVVVTALQGNLQISDNRGMLSLIEGETAEVPIHPASSGAGQGSAGPATKLVVYPTSETDILAGHTFVIKAQLLDAAGNPVNVAGIPVSFTLNPGPCNGGTPSSLLTQTGVTDASGFVSVTIKICTVEGNVDTVSVSSPGLTGATTANLNSVKRKKAGAAAGAAAGGGILFGLGPAAGAAIIGGIAAGTTIGVYEATKGNASNATP